MGGTLTSRMEPSGPAREAFISDPESSGVRPEAFISQLESSGFGQNPVDSDLESSGFRAPSQCFWGQSSGFWIRDECFSVRIHWIRGEKSACRGPERGLEGLKRTLGAPVLGSGGPKGSKTPGNPSIGPAGAL